MTRFKITPSRMSGKQRRKAAKVGYDRPKIEMVCDGQDIFIVLDGVKIARRGHPDTPQAKTWVSLEPGWRVLDGPKHISIQYDANMATH